MFVVSQAGISARPQTRKWIFPDSMFVQWKKKKFSLVQSLDYSCLFPSAYIWLGDKIPLFTEIPDNLPLDCLSVFLKQMRGFERLSEFSHVL